MNIVTEYVLVFDFGIIHAFAAIIYVCLKA